MLRFLLGSLSLMALTVACGVRGRPQPPLTPTELGRGQPTFKRTSDEFANPNVPSPDTTPSATPIQPRPTPVGL